MDQNSHLEQHVAWVSAVVETVSSLFPDAASAHLRTSLDSALVSGCYGDTSKVNVDIIENLYRLTGSSTPWTFTLLGLDPDDGAAAPSAVVQLMETLADLSPEY